MLIMTIYVNVISMFSSVCYIHLLNIIIPPLQYFATVTKYKMYKNNAVIAWPIALSLALIRLSALALPPLSLYFSVSLSHTNLPAAA